MPKVTVIANCHCLPIARTLALGATGVEVDFIDVNFLGQEPFASRARALVEGDDGTRIVFTFSFSELWGDVETRKLREVYGDRLFTFTNLHYTGLLPDVTYIGPMGGRKAGILSDYHSKLVLYGVASGRNEHDTVKLFNEDVYDKVGYFDAPKLSQLELLHRDQDLDVKFAEEFFSITQRECSMLTINHPTDVTLQYLTARLCEAANIAFAPSPPAYLMNSLAANCIWPIYDPIAANAKLLYRTPQRFIGIDGPSARGLALPDFVAASFSDYKRSTPDEIAETVEGMPFYSMFRDIIG